MDKLVQLLVALLLALFAAPAAFAHGWDTKPAVQSAPVETVSVASAGRSFTIGVTACGDESCPCCCGSCGTACSSCVPGAAVAAPAGAPDFSPARWDLFSPPLHLQVLLPVPTRPPRAPASPGVRRHRLTVVSDPIVLRRPPPV